MSVYKEAYFVIAEIIKQSVQIYPDACDFGVPYRKGDKNFTMVKEMLAPYGNEKTKKVNQYAIGKDASIVIEVMDEWDSGAEEKYKLDIVIPTKGIKYRNEQYDGYITITPPDKVAPFIQRKYGIKSIAA